jgi:hypothetical protein
MGRLCGRNGQAVASNQLNGPRALALLASPPNVPTARTRPPNGTLQFHAVCVKRTTALRPHSLHRPPA